MKTLFKRFLTRVHLRHLLPGLSLLSVLLAPVAASAQNSVSTGYYTSFGAKLSVPSAVTPGTVVARFPIPPSDLCFFIPTRPKGCYYQAVRLWSEAGSQAVTGPIFPSSVKGISVRLMINGQPATTADFSEDQLLMSAELQLLRNEDPLADDSFGNWLGVGKTHVTLCARPDQCTLGMFAAIRLKADVTAIPGTCLVRDQTVTLPTIELADLAGPGETAGPKSFDLEFINCPRGFNRVAYALVPTAAPEFAYPSTMAVNSDNASGVGIQILNRNEEPHAFFDSTEITEYQPTQGNGWYKVPLVARYIQTESQKRGGSISADMHIFMDYQ